MTNLEIIEQECIKINKILLDSPKYRPNESTCKHCYVIYLNPIRYGSEEEYDNGVYDEVIEKYFNNLYEAFNQIEIEMGVRPPFSFEEFMGDSYKGEPLQTQDQLSFRVKEISSLINKLQTGKISLPKELIDLYLIKENEKLTQALLDVKLENYAKTPEEIAYVDLYNEYRIKYSELFKLWDDVE